MAKHLNPHADRIKEIEKILRDQGNFKDNPGKQKFVRMLNDELKILKSKGGRK